MAHGGARRGAGRPKGRVTQAKRDLMEMAKDHGETALAVLVEIATNTQASEGARVSAANAILDRGYGKPAQTVDNKSSDGSMSPIDGGNVLDRINSRLDRLVAASAKSTDTQGPIAS